MQEYPSPDDVEYYYDDKHDPALKARVDENYDENYEEELRKAEANKTVQEPASLGAAIAPDLRNYTLQADFRDPFKSLPAVSICSFLALVVTPPPDRGVSGVL